MKKSLVISALALVFASTALAASSREVIELWPNGAPNKSTITAKESVDAKGNIINVTKARMELYQPKKSNGSAVVMIAGGGYGQLAMHTMEKSFAPFFNDLGYTVYMLKYRLPAGNPEVPLADVNKAVELAREHGAKNGIKTVGVMGMSAGGHLAAMGSVSCEGKSCPDFSVLVYPNLTMMQEETLPKSSCRKNLLGSDRSVQYDARFSAYKHVGLTTPPAFLAVSAQDEFAGSLGSMLYTRAMVENNRPVTLHVYPTGNHGWGVGKSEAFPDGDLFKHDLTVWLNSLK